MSDNAPDYEQEDADETPAQAAPPKPLHRATYASDNRVGGYNIRIVGPYPEKFAGKEVPVTTKRGATHRERLTKLIWTGTDNDSGQKAALYKFEPKPKEQDDLPF